MERRRKREVDLIVIGNGLVPLMASALGAEAGLRVVHYRFAERHPLPDHDWLHSGLLLDTDLPTAKRIRVWGRNMLRTFGMAASSERGVFLAQTNEAADKLSRYAEDLAVQIEELAASEAARLTGPHFSPSRSYAVPDTIFDKGALAGIALGSCVVAGVSIVNLDRTQSIALLPCDTAAGGFLIQTAQELTEGAITVLADAAVIPALLEPLGIGHRLAVYRRPLISIAGPDGLRAGLVVDLDRELSYVRHGAAGASSSVYTIAQTRWPAARAEVRPATDLLLSSMSLPRHRLERKVAVARDVEITEVQGNPPAVPWVYQFRREGFPGLVAAIANVANLALWTARQVMKLVVGDQESGSGVAADS